MTPERLAYIETQLVRHPNHPNNEALGLELVEAFRAQVAGMSFREATADAPAAPPDVIELPPVEPEPEPLSEHGMKELEALAKDEPTNPGIEPVEFEPQPSPPKKTRSRK